MASLVHAVPGECISLGDNGLRRVKLGRDTTRNTVSLNTTSIPLLCSRMHAEIMYSDITSEWYVKDNKSTNGTYVDGKKIHSGTWQQLTDGSSVSFGGPAYVIRDGQRIANPFRYLFRISAAAKAPAIPVKNERAECRSKVIRDAKRLRETDEGEVECVGELTAAEALKRRRLKTPTVDLS